MIEQLFDIEKLITHQLSIIVINGKTIFAGRLSLAIRQDLEFGWMNGTSRYKDPAGGG